MCAALVLAISVARAEEPPPPDEPRTWWGATQLREQWRPTLPESGALAVPYPITRDEGVRRDDVDAVAKEPLQSPALAHAGGREGDGHDVLEVVVGESVQSH